MNTSNLKSYAPQARKDFIAAVTGRANLLGLSEAKGQLVVAEAKISGDLVMIAGRPWPVKVNEKRSKLIARMQTQGFSHTVEAVAYAWFNRLAALRYMEVHDYLGHGRRVLSNPQGGLPEVLTHALDLAESNALPGLSADTVRELTLANQDPELYRLILIAQCNALHQAMPFLFEQLGDETELLLPENLLLTDSVVAKLVQSIPEEDWQQIEIIGWLYQFYISEKKDQVIGKVVRSEDIPAATQLFTPNWIVKYMVQNSLGAQWLATYPDSPLKAQMAYYIEPAEQTVEVNAQLAAITPSALNPEELTLIDPASGSGHILVEAYDLFKAIYLERGYRQRDVAKLILEKNLFGLDIDERAAQLTGFALMMKARADDRQLFERGVKLNVMAMVDSTPFDADRLAQSMKLSDFGLQSSDLTELKRLFEHAKTFGSLIQVPEGLAKKLRALKLLSEAPSQDLFVSDALKCLGPLVQQAGLLATQYEAVVANPPYMGSKGMNPLVKKFAKDRFTDAKSDLFSCFLERGFSLAKNKGINAMVTMESWMFLSSYEKFRAIIFDKHTIACLAHFPYDSKRPTVMGINFGVNVMCCKKTFVAGYRAQYCCSRYYELNDDGVPIEFPTANERLNSLSASEFNSVPGRPLAYWVSTRVRDVFKNHPPLSGGWYSEGPCKSGNDEIYLRSHWEVDSRYIGATSNWRFCSKGGEFRKYFGNVDHVLRWTQSDQLHYRSDPIARITSEESRDKRGITWPIISAKAERGFRLLLEDELFNSVSPAIFPIGGEFGGGQFATLAFLNSCVAQYLLRIMNPTLALNVSNVLALPIFNAIDSVEQAERCVELCVNDWNGYERSSHFQCLPVLVNSEESASSLEASYTTWITQNRECIAQMKRLEEANNSLFIDSYGLGEELTPEVPLEQVALTTNPAYRYGGNLNDEELWIRFRQDTMAELVSYAIGCMMGRYSLDAPGLIYANSGNVGFDASRYTKFHADADGIVPVTDELWFEDDAALRVREFLLAVWGKDSLEQNMAFLADNLGRKSSESPEQAIRRYLADMFFKDHLQTYKKRPIYWLFSSGRQGAFQALVYLHRYNAGTLSRLRAEYVVPLTGKMQSKIEALEQDIAASSSTAQRNKLTKQLEKLRKQHLELLAYDEQLRHYADQRITLDLDDGVKVNYGKFGDLLADVKSVVGKQEED
ncbi:BREX-1 system adenine-specific DNA-methyltransferase PglX [Thermomonas aquatica]|uniref:site-specific DNA-methyltransferase (adenine-specific) n=1 Tax=Thermomonas aquatica TaxID=2202149 RepID=A0A5B7ZR85_9GAMM|nr:BREX-1 system adenine-specific DNA-methyltransferase PglX [Thermomonas aquatica]QDA56986.1 BREX-1 system adenine-specific DNA-methyltransferase PglX [Thermomonas aquatica]